MSPEMLTTIQAITASSNSIVFILGAILTMRQLKKMHTAAKLQAWSTIAGHYISFNTSAAASPTLRETLGQDEETLMLHAMLARYELVWRMHRDGVMSDEDFDRYQIAVEKLRHLFKPAVIAAKYPFDQEFVTFILDGQRPLKPAKGSIFKKVAAFLALLIIAALVIF